MKTAIQELLGADLAAKHSKDIERMFNDGVPMHVIERVVRHNEHQDTEIAAGRCPKCGAPIKRYGGGQTRVRRSAVGLPNGPRLSPVGDWVMYRCSTQPVPGELRPDGVCDFMLDRFEAREAN